MKKTFILCLMATAIFALDSCKKDPVIIDDNGNVIDNNRKPIASFTYSTSENGSGLKVVLTNNSSYATSYEWRIAGPDIDEYSYEKNPVFYIYETGTYQIWLTAENQYGEDQAYKTLTVKAKPTGYRIKSLKLISIVMTDSNGQPWDTGLEANGTNGGYPDIYFKIENSDNSTTYYTSGYQNNVTNNDLPLLWSDVNQDMELNKEYRIAFYDRDNFSNDRMVNCIWNDDYLTPGVSTSYTWSATSGACKFTVELAWLYPAKGEPTELICFENVETDVEITGETAE